MQASCEEPNEELHHRTPGSCPELKADAQPLSHPGIPPYTKNNLKCIKDLNENTNTIKLLEENMQDTITTLDMVMIPWL